MRSLLLAALLQAAAPGDPFVRLRPLVGTWRGAHVCDLDQREVAVTVELKPPKADRLEAAWTARMPPKPGGDPILTRGVAILTPAGAEGRYSVKAFLPKSDAVVRALALNPLPGYVEVAPGSRRVAFGSSLSPPLSLVFEGSGRAEVNAQGGAAAYGTRSRLLQRINACKGTAKRLPRQI